MKRSIITAALLASISTFASAEQPITPESITAAQVQDVQSKSTYTYVRCWYRPASTHDDPSTDWEWAVNDDGSDYELRGYWYSSVSFKNMFYTETPQSEIQARCKHTLDVDHDTADMLYYAADNRWSYNHTIWTNDNYVLQPEINKVISLGDSISDTGNVYNGFQWLFPNDNAWFLGHFSNGFVWTEYLAETANLPLYTWAVGGAAGDTRYVVLSGIHDQVNSYLTYMKMAKNYEPKNSLFTLEFGLNDFVNYDRSVAEVSEDFRKAMKKLTENGAHNIIVLNLPDVSKAPQFKYSAPEKAQIVNEKIAQFNLYIAEQVSEYQAKGVNIKMFDTSTLFARMLNEPAEFGLRNTSDSCLDINRASSMDYLSSHSLRNDCATYGSDSYVFWGVTHPTTRSHQIIADEVSKAFLGHFNLK